MTALDSLQDLIVRFRTETGRIPRYIYCGRAAYGLLNREASKVATVPTYRHSESLFQFDGADVITRSDIPPDRMYVTDERFEELRHT